MSNEAEKAAKRAEEMANRQVAQFAAQSHRLDSLEHWRDGLRDDHDCRKVDVLKSLQDGLEALSRDWGTTRKTIIGVAVAIVLAALSACFWMGMLAQKVDSQSDGIQRIERVLERDPVFHGGVSTRE